MSVHSVDAVLPMGGVRIRLSFLAVMGMSVGEVSERHLTKY